MSRFTGSRVKKMRALGIDLPGLSGKTISRRPHPPGEHGLKRRRKPSEYSLQLKEKQKLRFNYGLNERQFRSLVKEARNRKEPTGESILRLLESRLDNMVFRAGFARTIPGARQLINHGHIQVNGKPVTIASYRIKVGDVVEPSNRGANMKAIAESFEKVRLNRPDWMEVDAKKRVAKVLGLPDPESVPFEVDVQLVIEYYAKMM